MQILALPINNIVKLLNFSMTWYFYLQNGDSNFNDIKWLLQVLHEMFYVKGLEQCLVQS